MKKRAVKKSKSSTSRRSVKKKNPLATLEKNNFFKYGIIVLALIIAALLVSSVVHSTGKVITGYTLSNECPDDKPFICNGGDTTCYSSPASCGALGIKSTGTLVTTKPAETTGTGTATPSKPKVKLPPNPLTEANSAADAEIVFKDLTIKTILDSLKFGHINSDGTPGITWKELIVFIIVLLVIFVIMFDILSLLSIFSKWTSVIIAGGICIVSSLMELTGRWTIWVMKWIGVIGLGMGAVEILMCLAIFGGLIFGSTWVAKFAAKRKGQVAEIRAITSAGQASAAITGLRRIQKNFEKP
jgi:hypothetical protein